MTTIFILICSLAAFILGDSHLLRDAAYAVRARLTRRDRLPTAWVTAIAEQNQWSRLDRSTFQRRGREIRSALGWPRPPIDVEAREVSRG